MPIPIRYTTTNVSSSVRLGNIALGVNAIGYGPSTTTGWANGVGATYDGYAGGFVIYYLSGTNIRIRTADTFTLITVAGQIMNATYASNAAALSALAGAGYAVINTVAPPNIVTSGSVLNLDADLVMSYPQTNTTWYDISGNAINGTLINGPTFDSVGAISFDGASDKVECLSTSLLNLSSTLSLEILMYPTSLNQNSGVLCKWTDGGGLTDNSYLFYLGQDATNSRYGFAIRQSNNTSRLLLPTTEYSINTWTHIVCTADGSTMRIYKNGVVDSTTQTYDGTIRTSAKKLVVGTLREEDSVYNYTGKIAFARVYNRALTQAEVTQNYYQGNIVTDGLVMALDAGNLVSYPATGTAWTALTGSINGTLINGPTFNSGNGGSIVFDGVNDYVTYSSLLNVSNTFTINCWIKPTSNIRQTIVSNGYPYQTNKGFFMTCPGNNSTDFFISLGQDQKIAVSGTGMITTGVWQMVTACVNGASELIKLYVNGIETTYSAQTDANITLQYDTGVFTTGCRNGTPGSDSLYSNFTTLQIYNKALSATEVRQNFNAQRNRFNL